MFDINTNNTYDSALNPTYLEEAKPSSSPTDDSLVPTSDNNSPQVGAQDEINSKISRLDIPIDQQLLVRREDFTSSTDNLMEDPDSSCGSSNSTFVSISNHFWEGSFHNIMHSIYTQMSAQQGIKKHGERAVAAIFKELKQLNDSVMPGKPVIAPIPFEELTDKKDKEQALEAVNLIKEKRYGKLKVRTCANGLRQHCFLKDVEEFTSPTASLESILTTLVVDAWEEHNIEVAGIVPMACLHASFPKDKRVVLKLQGLFVDIMCKVNPDFKKDIVYETTKCNKLVKYLCVRVLGALYGCIELAFTVVQPLLLNTLVKM